MRLLTVETRAVTTTLPEQSSPDDTVFCIRSFFSYGYSKDISDQEIWHLHLLPYLNFCKVRIWEVLRKYEYLFCEHLSSLMLMLQYESF